MKSAASRSPAPWCWPAGSATSCTPTATTARPATNHWPARRCTDEPRVAIRCCDVRAVTRISTSCTPGRAWTDGAAAPPRSHPAADARRRAVDGGAGRADGGAGMTSPYDVLSRITSNRRPPQPAGERCEMCSEADRRRASARGECGWAATDVRMPRLLSAVHRHPRRAALPRGARPVSVVSRLRAGSPRVGGAADPGRPGLLLPQLRARIAPSRSTRDRPGQPNPSSTWRRGTRSARADPRVGLLADDVEALLVRVPRGRSADPNAIWSRSTPATSSSAACGCCGAASTAARRPASSSTRFFAQLAGPQYRATPMTGPTDQATGLTFTVLDVAPEPYAVSPDADRAHRRSAPRATIRCTRSRCAARSASSRCDAATPTTRRPG